MRREKGGGETPPAEVNKEKIREVQNLRMKFEKKINDDKEDTQKEETKVKKIINKMQGS